VPSPYTDSKSIFKLLLGFIESDKKDYKILSKNGRRAKFLFLHFDVTATISLEKDFVTVETESIFNVPNDHPASYAIKRELRGRHFCTRINPSKGLVLFLSFSVGKDGYFIANEEEVGPYLDELIADMRGMIDAIWLIVIEKFPYLAGQQTVRVAGEPIIVSTDSSQKTIQSAFSTVITKPVNHRFTSILHEWIFGISTSNDDDRLLPNFFFDKRILHFFAPKEKLVAKRGGVSKYETIGTHKRSLKPFFDFLSDLSRRIQKLPIDERSLCAIILRNIKRILDDEALIGTLNGETIVVTLDQDIRDHYHYAKEQGVISAIAEEDVREIAKWRELIQNAILFGKYEERVIRARFAARILEEAPKTLGAEKRKLNRVGGGFSVYISPTEAQICNLGKEVGVEIVEEGKGKYLTVKRLPE